MAGIAHKRDTWVHFSERLETTMAGMALINGNTWVLKLSAGVQHFRNGP